MFSSRGTVRYEERGQGYSDVENVGKHWSRLIECWKWKSADVGIYQLLNWKMQGETLKFVKYYVKRLNVIFY